MYTQRIVLHCTALNVIVIGGVTRIISVVAACKTLMQPIVDSVSRYVCVYIYIYIYIYMIVLYHLYFHRLSLLLLTTFSQKTHIILLHYIPKSIVVTGY